MKTTGIKIKAYAQNINVIDSGNLQSKIFVAMLWSFGALSILYLFILGNMVWNIVERRSFESQAIALSSEIGELELEYLNASSKIDPELGAVMGFKEAEIKQFVTRKSLGSVEVAQNEL